MWERGCFSSVFVELKSSSSNGPRWPPQHLVRREDFWRSTGAPTPRSMLWRDEASNFTPPCAIELPEIGAIAAGLPIAGSWLTIAMFAVVFRPTSSWLSEDVFISHRLGTTGNNGNR